MTQSRPFTYFELLRKPWNVPERLKKYTCLCERDGLYLPIGIEPPKINGQYWVCSTCKKLPIYHFFKCFECDEGTLLDFRHPKFCSVDPLCWKCLTTVGPACSCVLPKIKEQLGEMEPYLPKPRVFTSEELESVFDF